MNIISVMLVLLGFTAGLMLTSIKSENSAGHSTIKSEEIENIEPGLNDVDQVETIYTIR